MEKIRAIVLLLFAVLLCAFPIQAQLGLEQAANAYESGDYAGAIALWETAHQNGVRDGTLYYNLGAAYYESGDLARTLINMLRASVYLPRDPNVQIMLARIRAQRADPSTDETDLLTLAGTFTNTAVTMPELAASAFALYCLFFACIAIYVMRPVWRVFIRWVIVCLALMVVCCLILLGSRMLVEQQRPAAVVIAPTTEAMSGPGLDYLPLFSLLNAAEVRIVDGRTGWVRVALADGRQGWLPVEALEKI